MHFMEVSYVADDFKYFIFNNMLSFYNIFCGQNLENTGGKMHTV